MSSKTKIKICIFLLISFLFLYSTYHFLDLGTKNLPSEFNNNSIINTKKLQISAVSERIHIDDNWTAAKAAGICTGSGNYSDPYIIEDLIIDGGGSGSCIWIEDSYSRFRIENCTVFNSGSSTSNAGIKLSNAHWCQLIGNNCSFNTIGMGIYSSDVEMRGNIASFCSRGIYIYHCRYSYGIVSGNTLTNNTVAGIYLDYSDVYEISENAAVNNYNGIYLTRSDYNQILRNIVSNNTNHGISMYNSNRNYLFGNDACHNPYGIFAQGGYFNTIERNNASNTTETGILFTYSNSNDILNNNASHNSYGIELYSSNHNLISRNVVNNNIHGISLSSSDYNVVTRNLLAGNNVCIAEVNCIENEFSGNGSCTYGQSDEEDISLDLLISSLSILGGIAIILALFLSNIKKRKKKD